MTPAWMRGAPCAGLTDLFFPDAGERPERFAERLALCQRICHGCDRIIACSIHARTNNEFGIWAGRMHWGIETAIHQSRQRAARRRAS